MAPDDPTTAKQRLLAGTIDYVAEHGVGDLSLRRLATALGTSHRMLIYHFGSKDGLFIEVVRAVEAQQRAALAELGRENDGSPAEIMRAMWKRLADPALWPNERLFFELYGQALQRRAHAEPLLDGIVELWLEPAAALARQHGVPPAEALAFARLGLAITRGLLLDLLATGDRAGVDRAMEHFVELYERSTFWTTSNSSSAEP